MEKSYLMFIWMDDYHSWYSAHYIFVLYIFYHLEKSITKYAYFFCEIMVQEGIFLRMGFRYELIKVFTDKKMTKTSNM